MKWLKKSMSAPDQLDDEPRSASSNVARHRVQANEQQDWVALYAMATPPIVMHDLTTVLAPLGFERTAQHTLVCSQADVPIRILNIARPGTLPESPSDTCRGVVILMAPQAPSSTISHAFSMFLACVDTLKTLETTWQFGASPKQVFETAEAWDTWVISQRQKCIDLETAC